MNLNAYLKTQTQTNQLRRVTLLDSNLAFVSVSIKRSKLSMAATLFTPSGSHLCPCDGTLLSFQQAWLSQSLIKENVKQKRKGHNALGVIGDVEGKTLMASLSQRIQWRQRQSSWRPFRFSPEHIYLSWQAISVTMVHGILTHWGRDKWPPFYRRHFQMHFLQWKCIDFE